MIYTSYEIAAQNSADFPIFRGHATQHGTFFAQTLGRTAILFIKKYIIPAAKTIGANLFEFAAPEIGEVVSGRKKTQNICKTCKQIKLFVNNWDVEKRKTNVEIVEPDPFLKKLSRKPLVLAKTFLKKKNEDKSK